MISDCVVCCEETGAVVHLYTTLDDAAACAKAYADADGITAWVTKINPPLAAVRTADQLGVFDKATRTLSMRSPAVVRGVLATNPSPKNRFAVLIRQAQPLNEGVPQFTPTPRPSRISLPGAIKSGAACA